MYSNFCLTLQGPGGSQNQPYYGGGYSGGPFTPIPCGTHSTHSGPPTPPNGVGASGYHMPAHKDERAQRQFVKLRRKYEQTRRDRETASFQNHYHQNGSYKRGGMIRAVERPEFVQRFM